MCIFTDIPKMKTSWCAKCYPLEGLPRKTFKDVVGLEILSWNKKKNG